MNNQPLSFFILWVALASMLLGCGDDEGTLPTAVTDVEPNRGAEGMRIKIKGNSFGEAITDHVVFFSGQAAAIEEVSNEEIIVVVPEGVNTGTVSLSLGGTTYEGPVFTVLEEEVSLSEGFSEDAGVTTEGTSFVYESETQPGLTVLRLTPPKARRVGFAYYGTKVPVMNGFETTFDFQVHEVGAPASQTEDRGSEGFAFVIQNQGINARGHMGASMGYAGIRNSVAVEFDVYQNQDDVVSSFADPNGNHISVQTNTNPSEQFGETGAEIYHSLAYTTVDTHPDLPELTTQGSDKHSARIVYSAAPGNLQVFVDDNLVLSVDMELSDYINAADGRAYVGFTASTSLEDRWASHDILNWSLEPVE